MGERGRRRGRGLPLRAYLVVLVLVPLLGLMTLTGALVAHGARDARAAARAELAVVVSGQVAAVRSAVALELLVSSARVSVAAAPAGLADVAAAVDAELGAPQLVSARTQTDAALELLAASGVGADRFAPVARDVGSLRAGVDAGKDSAWLADAAEQLTGQLSVVERDVLDEAATHGMAGEVVAATLDTRTAADAATLASRDAVTMIGTLVATAGATQPDARGATTTDGSTSAALESLGRSTSAGVRVRSAELLQSTRALPPTTPVRSTGAAARDLASRAAGRQQGLVQLVVAADEHADQLAAAQVRRVRDDAVDASALTLTSLLVSAVTAALTGRTLVRSLNDLATTARHISQGRLAAPVQPRGPREMRTVAAGLAATAASLSRVQAQARAVRAGDLTSTVLARPLPGPLGEVLHASITSLVGAMLDRDRLQEDLTHRATHDSLTELPNRSHAMAVLDEALRRADRTGQAVGVLFVDLDRFKQVNDTLGHAAGDGLLRVVADRLRTVVRPGDVVCRLGGDEFLVVVEPAGHADAGRDHLLSVAEQLVTSVSRPVDLAEGTASVGASVGVAWSRPGRTDREALLAEADLATYRVKAGGRGGVGCYDDALRAELDAVRDLEEALARAVAQEELVLHYQAVVTSADREVVGYEALVRWDRPGHGLVPPSAFVGVAERSALVCDLGRWVLHEATQQMVQWSAAGGAVTGRRVGVNVSGRHLASPRVVDDVRDALEASGLAPSRLVLEITETVLVDLDTAHDRLAELRALGVGVAIDDFGTGFTSIAQLQRLPADVLKVDRSLAGSDEPADQALVRLVVGAARASGLEVVAEGVETQAQLAAVAAASCALVQGYVFHRPLPPGLRAPELAAAESQEAGPASRPAPTAPALPRPRRRRAPLEAADA
ncbi:putative bifunctional diguanylate cyclase/phosphodiesterase [Pseudokineococcus sp. 1T1Z-3]|uniref:putative bifunctional diguanylate cyclase/phosphodiesterase n=1 Tax=Pseudokineococcus sp. 1T1Z-3 TaxID=3132745 RepID=UPI0030A31290